MTGLEALEKVKRTIKAELAELDLMGFEKSDKYNYLEQLLNELTDVEKSLKALEIIKEKRVDLPYLRCCFEDNQTVERYNEYIRNKTMDYDHEQELTEEEFNTLKEVLE